MRAVAALVPLVPLALLTAGACSGDDDDGPGVFGGAGAGDLATIAGGLVSLPETGEPTETIVWGDLERAAEVAGVDRPADPGDEQAARDYLQALTIATDPGAGTRAAGLVTPEAAHVDRSPDQAEFVDEVGWSILGVDRFVERQTPPGVVTVMQGSFDEGALTEALGEPDAGTWTVGSGDDYAQNLRDLTPARPLGESLWLGLDGDRLSVARSSGDSAAVRRVLAGEDDTPTFAADESLAALAGALDAEEAYAAMLVRPGLSGRPEQAPAACEQGLPEATTAVGGGVTDDDGPVVLLAIAHGSPAAAEANAPALERIAEEGTSLATNQPWSEIVSVDGVSVADDGRTVVARLRPQDPGNAMLWFRLLTAQDSLVTSCAAAG